jgi:nucleotide-binding universal stress UspA family protein
MQAIQMKQQRVTFRNILFATDFSHAANSAMPYAAGLARSFGAKLFVLHVKEPINYALPPGAWETAQFQDDLEMENLRKGLHSEFSDLHPEVLEGEGKVWTTVAAAIETHKIDLVVVGTRGRSGIEKVLLGSQAEEVLRHTRCPVLTVGPGAESEEGKRGKLASILYATDFGPASLAAAPVAISLAEENQSRLTLLHVIEGHGAHEAKDREEFGETSEEKLRALVPVDAGFWCAPHFLVEQELPKEKILETARRTNADLIVLGARIPEGVPGASTHLSIATVHHIVANAGCPVLTVRG